jgi:hypothetical protein
VVGRAKKRGLRKREEGRKREGGEERGRKGEGLSMYLSLCLSMRESVRERWREREGGGERERRERGQRGRERVRGRE